MIFSSTKIESFPTTEAVVFESVESYGQKVLLKAVKHYHEGSVEFACPVCESVRLARPVELAYEDSCPCCGVNLCYDIEDIDKV